MRGLLLVLFLSFVFIVESQHISDFTSLSPKAQDEYLYVSSNHLFQELIKKSDAVQQGGEFKSNFDFTGYIPIKESSTHGYLAVNFELTEGGMAISELKLDSLLDKWEVKDSKLVDFSIVGGTSRNCSGTVTPWNTIVTCEEAVSLDNNNDGYNDIGWCIEVDPVSGLIVDQAGGLAGGDKLWSLGNFKHENVVVHPNLRTVYEGADEMDGYLYKFVMDSIANLSKGALYVYKGSKSGSGKWLRVKNETPEECNTVKLQADSLGATKFNGIEDVDINPLTGHVFFAVKGEEVVYSFMDDNLLAGDSVKEFKTFVGGQTYYINGVEEDWGYGNDNLSFDDRGNLWVLQDGGRNYVWVVDYLHTQEDPKVKIVMRIPRGAEPTGLTFTPDYKYGFMSVQHPSTLNSSIQMNAFREDVIMDKDFAFVFSRSEFLNSTGVSLEEGIEEVEGLYPNPSSNVLRFSNLKNERWELINQIGALMKEGIGDVILLEGLQSGIYFLLIGEEKYKVVKK